MNDNIWDEKYFRNKVKIIQSAQDNVTHFNEKGKEHSETTQWWVNRRNDYVEDLVNYVRNLV